MSQANALLLDIEECRTEDWLGAAQRWHHSTQLSRCVESRTEPRVARHPQRRDPSFAACPRNGLWVLLVVSCAGLFLI
jgi:hypothetical protein